MRRAFLIPCALVVLAACSDSPAAPRTRAGDVGGPVFAAQATTSNEVLPVNLIAFVPCANGGSGEVVNLAGNLHVLTHVTITPSGHVTVRSHFQPQGISGTGVVSGDKYQATGVTQETFAAGALPVTNTFVNNYRIIGPGRDNNYTVHQTTHITVNANGTVTVSHSESRVVCG